MRWEGGCEVGGSVGGGREDVKWEGGVGKEGGCEVGKKGGCCRPFIGEGHHFPTWYWYFAVNGTHRAVQRVT